MNFLNRKPREIGRLRTEYSPPEAKAVDAMIERMKAAQVEDEYPPPAPLEVDLLQELRVILRCLTWGQMQEYCAGTKSNPQDVHEWSSK